MTIRSFETGKKMELNFAVAVNSTEVLFENS
jgi:hypothetical protein